jgi:hypothetical protein
MRSAALFPGRVIAAAVLGAVTLLLFSQTFPHFGSPNEYSRLHLVSAIVDDHTVQTDGAIVRYGDVQDGARFQGRSYSDKPIGYALLAVPFYAALSFATGGVEGDTALRFLRIFVNLLPLALFLALFHRSLRDDAGAGAWSSVLLVALVFGSLMFVYAQLFMSHMLTGLVWFVAYRCVARAVTWRASLGAGALMGYAFLLEVPSALVAAVYVVWLLWQRPRLAPAFAVGVALLAAPAFIYNTVLFGHPLEWAYHHMKDPQQRAGYASGWSGWHAPSIPVLWELAAGSSRGFFRYMPHLAAGLWGLIESTRRRSDSGLALAVIAVTLLFVSGMHNWDGAWCFGPRYLVPLIPFLVWGTGLWISRHRAANVWLHPLYLALLGVTIPFMLFGAATFPFTPPLDDVGLRLYPVLFWEGLIGDGWLDRVGIGSLPAGIAAAVLIVAACLLAIRLPGRLMAVFVAALSLAFPATLLLERRVEPRLTALENYVAGAVGYYQGRYDRSGRFLKEALRRNPEPWLREQAEHLLTQVDAAGGGSRR